MMYIHIHTSAKTGVYPRKSLAKGGDSIKTDIKLCLMTMSSLTNQNIAFFIQILNQVSI